ncbi:MAG: ABC transporter ATP-binding protein [Acetobacteraceae bacterium]|nr:ABC transporter ATP-binding protein [Acetobacteraceae bacterium]MDW8398449.1 ABC transporter ATP-binding protein [Acetobacteraceae bacterium]
MLEASGLTKRFGGLTAVDGVSFTLRARTITGLIGPNGAGKTTLFNLIAGALRPDAGRLTLEGRDITGARPHSVFAAGIGRTFQIPRPFPEMTLLENVMLAPKGQAGERFWVNWLAPRRVAAEERRVREAARHWLEFVGLSHLAREPAKVLSGGQRKLLEIARVMVAEPRLVLLDEPGAGVNPALLEAIMEKISALNAEGVTFLIIEHNMDLVMSLCRPVLVMAGGRLLMEGEPEAVRSDPRVAEAYLGVAA